MIRSMGDNMQIHLSKPGGQREGPYTLEQINRDLAAQKYRDTDYWAWHEDMAEWVPLYALPGVATTGAAASAEVATPAPEEVTIPANPQLLSADGPAAEVATSASATAPEPEKGLAPVHPRVSSGMPFPALEHIFLFTTGEGPPAWDSPAVGRMLEETVGEGLSAIRQNTPRDVVAKCDIVELLRDDGSISDAVWRVMATYRPALVQQARERAHHICVRTFRIESDTVVTLVLFYNKEKL
jgi:hypothetical protein